VAAETPLFCPFCGECFEGEERCPEHDIPLVPFEKLDRLRGRPLPEDDEPVDFWDLRFGRGVVLLGALLTLVGFFLPFVSSAFDERSVTASAFQTASGGAAMNLWVVPLVTLTLVSVIMRRRTPNQMRGMRLLVPALGGLAATSLGYTLYRILAGASEVMRLYGAQVEVAPAWGAVVLCVGILLVILGGVRLGAAPPEKAPRYDVD